MIPHHTTGMMKSSVLISMLAIFAIACHPVNVPDDSTAVLPESFVAKIGDVADVHGPWTEGETFTVFGSQESAVYAYDKSAKRFRCVDVGKRLTVSGSYHAVCPAAFGEQVSPGEFHVTIPARQEWLQKYVSPQANIMVAVSDNVAAEELTFHSAVGYLKVIAKSTERIRSVTLSGNGGEVIAGAASLKAENESIPLLSMTGSGKTVVIDCGSEGVEPLPDGNEFIFCLPGVTFSKGVTVVVDSEKLTAAKTATLAKQLKKLNLDSALFVGADVIDENFKKSVANINNVDVLPTVGLNVLDILKHDKLVLTADAVKAIEARLAA